LEGAYLDCIKLAIGLVLTFVYAAEGALAQEGNNFEFLLELLLRLQVQLHYSNSITEE
jgi:hypothetical protein